MERYDLRADAAFTMLVRLSQEWHTSVIKLAERITQSDPD
ncbi:ANTAR domain-containing protein [Rhodococcus sp. NBC_00294]|nr:ANTAR domain-containing protein [Rhodococcus sp. NBC_00294]